MENQQLRPVTTYPAVVGGVLTQIRNQRNLRQDHIAKAVGITQTSWSRIETGQSSLTVEHLRLAAHALGHSPGDILHFAEQATASLEVQGVDIKSTRNEIDMKTAVAVIAAASLAAIIAISIAKSSK